MSRHRLVRNMNIAEELDDEAMSDGAEDELSPEEYERLENGLEHIRTVIGSEAESGMSDQDIKDALWNNYYDAQQTINWILEEQSKRKAAQERRVNKPLPSLPEEEVNSIGDPRRIIPAMHTSSLDDESSHIIRLGSHSSRDLEEFYHEMDAAIPLPEIELDIPYETVRKSPSLTTISERTERTETSHDWPRVAQQSPLHQRLSRNSWTTTTDYGQVIEKPSIVDPNTIPPSPTLSALQRLSIAEPPPSASSTGSRTPTAPSIPLPVVDDPPPAVPAKSKSTMSDIIEESRSQSDDVKGKSRSKLSALASSRSSVGSRTSGTYTVDSGSVMTYPPLRPSSQSCLSLTSEGGSVGEATATGASSMSSHVRRAIETALQMEAMDAVSLPTQSVHDPPPQRTSAPVPEVSSITSPSSTHPVSLALPEIRSRPTSKLSQLAHARAATPSSGNNPIQVVPPSSVSTRSDDSTSTTKPPPSRQTPSASDSAKAASSLSSHSASQAPSNSQAHSTSKLSQLAQARTQQIGPVAPEENTPVANEASSRTSEHKPVSKLGQLVHAKAQTAAPLQLPTKAPPASSVAPSPASSGTRPVSKLAQLAHAKAQQPTPLSPPAAADTSSPKVAEAVAPIAASPKPVSKLAQLAQAKAQQGQQNFWMPPPKRTSAPPSGLMVHQSHTEYITPIANGPTATTAITTTYQSLSGLAQSRRSEPSTRSMHMFSPKKNQPSTEPKQSKLAMKSKRAHKQPEAEPEPTLVPLDPMFLPSVSRARASPSPFASLLIDGGESPEDGSSKGKGRSDGARKREDANDRPRRHKSHRDREVSVPSGPSVPVQVFAFDVPSPDDVVFNARRGTSLAQRTSASSNLPPSASPSRASVTTAKEREKAQKLAQQKKAAETNSRLPPTPPTAKKSHAGARKGGIVTPVRSTDAEQLDLAALNLNVLEEIRTPPRDEPSPKITVSREKVLEEAKKAIESKDDKKGVSLVVIGHVDAGKSTLMGRLLYELGKIDEKKRMANERASSKIGKSSFSWAWEFDGTTEERERGITMDVALQTMSTPHRLITILDAPGHRDFIPNMISGAAQADCALMVVDASTGEFEAGFERGGQTREHLLLVRSLGVGQVIIAVNKLDQVQWERARYEEICSLLRPFLLQSGFQPSKTKFVPVGAMAGINLVNREGSEAAALNAWYNGPTLVDLLDQLEPPTRDITAPLRFPISNVFRGQTSGIAVSGRVCGGLVQVGERLRVLPGDETALVKSIESEDESLTWAAAGQNVTLYLTAVDPVHLNIGSVLCPPTDVIPLAMTFTARIIVFDIQIPITAGASVELYHHSRDVPASISRLIATIDRATGTVLKKNPRVLAKSASAEVQITLRSPTYAGASVRVQPIPLEPFSVNKEMGRVLIRRAGETIAAGIVLEITSNGNGT